MGRAIETEDAYKRLQIQYEAVRIAQVHDSSSLEHEFLEMSSSPHPERYQTPSLKLSGQYIVIKKDKEQELDKSLYRRKWMIYGEGVLLIGLLSVCALMLLRLVRIRKSVQNEMEMFVGQMTHEMKTPLAGLRALLETLQKGAIPKDRLNEVLDMGLRQIDREEHLVQTLLHAQQLRISEQPFSKDTISLNPFIAEFIQHRIQSRNSDSSGYSLTISPDLHWIGDQQAILTILENLADNADKYGATHLNFEAEKKKNQVVLTLIDDGCGFDAVTAHHLFEPYVRGANSDSKHGTGLGLHISRRLARAMGGDLQGCSDGNGMGAMFQLSLPQEPE